jgi:hypothetical protein
VVGIDPTGDLTIEIDAVLTPRHPDFGPPAPGEMFRYHLVTIRFPDTTQLEWIHPLELSGHRDPDGSIDYGNIDFFVRAGQVSHLGGDWGEVRVTSGIPLVGARRADVDRS